MEMIDPASIEAIMWLVALSDGRAHPIIKKKLQNWLNADPNHVATFARVVQARNDYISLLTGASDSGCRDAAGRVASPNFLTVCLTRILTVGAGSSVQANAGIPSSSGLSHIVLAQAGLTPKALEAQDTTGRWP